MKKNLWTYLWAMLCELLFLFEKKRRDSPLFFFLWQILLSKKAARCVWQNIMVAISAAIIIWVNCLNKLLIQCYLKSTLVVIVLMHYCIYYDISPCMIFIREWFGKKLLNIRKSLLCKELDCGLEISKFKL